MTKACVIIVYKGTFWGPWMYIWEIWQPCKDAIWGWMDALGTWTRETNHFFLQIASFQLQVGAVYISLSWETICNHKSHYLLFRFNIRQDSIVAIWMIIQLHRCASYYSIAMHWKPRFWSCKFGRQTDTVELFYYGTLALLRCTICSSVFNTSIKKYST